MKSKHELVGLGRSPLVNQIKALSDSITKALPVYNMDGLVSENKWTWIKKNFGSIWRGHYKPYPVYSDSFKNNGIFKIHKPGNSAISIALLSDWASDTAESQLIAAQAGIQDYSIHLGDTYYVGNEKEIAENFNTDKGGTWPYGKYGSFAMIGNHEMYSSGQSYFTQLLPRMGIYKDGKKKVVQTQLASFFCLENEYWRIIGLDTGYDSLTGLFGLTPNRELDLTPEQKSWLENTIKLNDDNRGIIFLSHHQCFSAFEIEFPNPAETIASLISPTRNILWFWGHEHMLSVYGPNKLQNGSTVFARCIGNSGMPVELKNENGSIKAPKSNDPANPQNRNLILYDQRQREVIKGDIPLGHNGYVLLDLEDDKLSINYFDDNNGGDKGRKILQENWTIDLSNGNLTGDTITDLTLDNNEPLNAGLSLFGENLQDAINAI